MTSRSPNSPGINILCFLFSVNQTAYSVLDAWQDSGTFMKTELISSLSSFDCSNAW